MKWENFTLLALVNEHVQLIREEHNVVIDPFDMK